MKGALCQGRCLVLVAHEEDALEGHRAEGCEGARPLIGLHVGLYIYSNLNNQGFFTTCFDCGQNVTLWSAFSEDHNP